MVRLCSVEASGEWQRCWHSYRHKQFPILYIVFNYHTCTEAGQMVNLLLFDLCYIVNYIFTWPFTNSI